MGRFFRDIENLIFKDMREKKRYQDLLNGPEEERAINQRFGKKAIFKCIMAIICTAISIVFAIFARVFHQKMQDPSLAVGFEFILIIICMAVVVLLDLYALINILTRHKFVKWQRTLNDLPIGKRAEIFYWIALVVVLVLIAVSVILIVTALL